MIASRGFSACTRAIPLATASVPPPVSPVTAIRRVGRDSKKMTAGGEPATPLIEETSATRRARYLIRVECAAFFRCSAFPRDLHLGSRVTHQNLSLDRLYDANPIYDAGGRAACRSRTGANEHTA